MYQIPLAGVANQSISFNVDGAYWQLHVYQSISHMCIDIAQNGVAIASGVRCFVGIPLMQYPYMYLPNFGNFVFDSNPDWTNFGTSCNLYYLEQAELNEFTEAIMSGEVV